MSKGSKRRPRHVKQNQFDDNWDKVFGKKQPNKPEKTDSSDADGWAKTITITVKTTDQQ